MAVVVPKANTNKAQHSNLPDAWTKVCNLKLNYLLPFGLDWKYNAAITTKMRHCQTIFPPVTKRCSRFIVLSILSALLVVGCSDNRERAYNEGQQAQALLDAGDLAGARAAIGRALSLSDDQIELLLLDGRIKFRMQDFQAAFDSYNLALAIDPANTEAMQAVSQIGVSIGFERESEEATDRILMLDPQQPDALLVKGVHALNKRKFDEAQAIGEAMLKANPQSEAGIVLKARAMFLAGKRPEAFALLSDAIERIGRTQLITTALLECARDQADADIMVEQYRVLSELVPDNVDLTVDEANIRYKSGFIDEARSRGYALLTQNGDKPDAMQRLSDLWTEYDPKPLSADQIAALSSQGRPAARIMAARHYLGTGDAKTAAALVAPLQSDAVLGLKTRIQYALGDPGALGGAEWLLESDKTNCDALTVRNASEFRRKQSANAVISAQVVVAECPDRADGFLMLAQAYGLAGKPEGVRRAFNEGVESLPLTTRIVARYVDWLLANGRRDSALAIAKRLTQRAPAKVSAWQLLKSTCARADDRLCADEATKGEAQARRNFLIDLPPGERRPNPLLGNSWR